MTKYYAAAVCNLCGDLVKVMETDGEKVCSCNNVTVTRGGGGGYSIDGNIDTWKNVSVWPEERVVTNDGAEVFLN